MRVELASKNSIQPDIGPKPTQRRSPRRIVIVCTMSTQLQFQPELLSTSMVGPFHCHDAPEERKWSGCLAGASCRCRQRRDSRVDNFGAYAVRGRVLAPTSLFPAATMC